jgi:hypothetical protein
MKRLILFLGLLPILTTGCIINLEYDERECFIGSYEVDEYSESLDAYAMYDFRIRRDHNDDYTVYIENFYDADLIVYAEIYGSKIKIPSQWVDGYLIEGHGSLHGHELTLNYSVTVNHMVDYCNAICDQY